MLGVAGLLVLTLALAFLFRNWHLDRSFITYRVAQNLATGEGFAYNPGERVLLDDAAPLYTALLALGSQVTPDLPRLGNLIGSAAVALGMVGLFLLARSAGNLSALLAAGVYAASPLLWLSLGSEAPLWMALALLAVWLYLRNASPGAAVLLALATLTRPEAAVLVVVIAADAVLTGRRFRILPPVAYVVLLGAGLMAIRTQVDGGGLLPGFPGGDAFAPTAIAGLGELASGLMALSPLWAALPVLALAGVVQAIRAPRPAHGPLLLAVWAALHVLTLIILGVPVMAWHYLPLYAALVALAGLGVKGLAGQVRQPAPSRAMASAGVLLLAGAAGHTALALTLGGSPERWAALAPDPASPAYGEAGQWLRENTPPGASVGTAEIGVLGYTSERPIVDAGGRLQPGIAAANARGDAAWWLNAYAPEYLALDAGEVEALAGDGWFREAYAEIARTGPAGEVTILTRTTPPAPMTRHAAGLIAFPGGLRLNALAADFALDPLEEGRLARVELEWLLDEPVAGTHHVAIRVENHEGALAALQSAPLDLTGAPVGELFTTWHSITLAPSLQPGVYDVSVGVGPDPSELTWHAVAQGKIPFPESAFIGAVSGSQVDFGDLALVGYRLARMDQDVEIILLWQAMRAPQTDYIVFVQVRNAQGAVLAHEQREPQEGAYPTSVWSPQERVPDTYLMEGLNLPPGDYEVYTGLLDAEGNRVLTRDGRDAVLVGRLSVTP